MSALSELMLVEWIEPKRLNSNVMRGERYENTKRDIELNGIQEKLRLIPKDIYTGDPEQPHDRYVIEDGNQRHRIAVELGIEAVPYEIVERGEVESLARTYRHQANRGEQDPLVEAEMFQFYLDHGLTQEQVVEELGLSSAGYLTDRLYLLKLSEEVRLLLRIAERFFSWATVVFLIGAWVVLIGRGHQREVSLLDFLLSSLYTSLFWGMVLLLIGYIFLAFPGLFA